MKHPINAILLLGLTIFNVKSGYCQSVGPSTLDAAGGNSTIGGITHEYAIGQVAAGNTFASASLVVTPGVLQPASSTGIKTQGITEADLRVYPSPVENTLFLQPAFKNGGMLRIRLFDAAGRQVLSSEIELQRGDEQQTLAVEQLAIGQYQLQVVWKQGGIEYLSGYKIHKLK